MNKSFVNIHQSLIDKCVNNDEKAQFEIYKLYYKAMYNTSLRIVINSADAEDIMQESFLQAFRKIKSYEKRHSFGSWLKRIVINKSFDYLRRKKINVNLTDYNLEDINKDTGIEYNKELLYKIKKCIPKLPNGYRNVLTLYLIEGYDHSEIAQILNISSTTSRTQYIRAKKRLIDLIK